MNPGEDLLNWWDKTTCYLHLKNRGVGGWWRTTREKTIGDEREQQMGSGEVLGGMQSSHRG